MPRDSSELEHALLAGEVSFAFQPVVDLRTGDVHYTEALARWDDPDRGRIKPARFLQLVDNKRLADLLTERALHDAIDALPLLRERYGSQVRIGVNLSNLQLKASAAELVVDAARTSDGDSEWLTIEIVEDLVIDDLEVLTTALDDCRASGARVMIDDFGTGTATLSMLTDLGYDGVKLDRRYVSAISTSTPARLLVESLIRFGHGANVDVVAEGVENPQTANELRGMHCRFGQGYHFARPMSLDELSASGSMGGLFMSPRSPAPAVEPSSSSDRDGGVDTDATTAERVRARLVELEPTASSLSYADLLVEITVLEGLTASVNNADLRMDLVIEVRHRRVLCALYFSRIDEVIGGGLELADFCDRQNRPAAQADALALVASTSPANTEQSNIAADALARMLQIRDRETLDLAALTKLDNNIGAIFAHLGLLDEAFNWWLHNLRRAGALPARAATMTRLNLIEHALARNEVSRFGYASHTDAGDDDHELLDELLEHTASSVWPDVHAGYVCRRHVLAGDLVAAAKVVGEYDNQSGMGILAHYGILRASAILRRAEGDVEGFLKATTELVSARPERGVMLLQQRAKDRLHAEALAANGRYQEAFEFMQYVLENEARESSAATGSIYAWLQSQVASDRPFLRGGAR